MPPDPSIMRACRETRRRVSAMTTAQRRALEKRARALIASGAKKRPIEVLFTLDNVLASQLKALNCTFNVTYDGMSCPRLHIGPPDTFWTTARRLLELVQWFYREAQFAPTDAEGCVSIALEGL